MLNLDKQLSKESLDYFNYLIEQRSKRKPIAYLINKKEFWKNEFYVSKDVLIPRPDTEVIVEQVLSLTKHKSQLSILDVGVGSGCIILSILKERKKFYGTGIDVSKKSINICKINSNKLGVYNRLKLFKSDVDNFDYGKYDLIISNPPYLKTSEINFLDPEVKFYDPNISLDGGCDGLNCYKDIAKNAKKHVNKNSKICLEIGLGQSNSVTKIFDRYGFKLILEEKDLQGINRVVVYKLK